MMLSMLRVEFKRLKNHIPKYSCPFQMKVIFCGFCCCWCYYYCCFFLLFNHVIYIHMLHKHRYTLSNDHPPSYISSGDCAINLTICDKHIIFLITSSCSYIFWLFQLFFPLPNIVMKLNATFVFLIWEKIKE